METSTIGIIVAAGAAGLAILVAIIQKLRPKPAESTPPLAGGSLTCQSVKPARAQRRKNRRGWTAPKDHWFDEDDHLYGPDGQDIVDLILIAQLCETLYDPMAEIEESVAPVEEMPSSPVFEAVEVSSNMSVIEQTDTKYGSTDGGDSDSGGCDDYDSGSGDCGGGDD